MTAPAGETARRWTVHEGGLHVVVEAVGDRVKMDAPAGLPSNASPTAIAHLIKVLTVAALAAHLHPEVARAPRLLTTP